MMRDAIVLTIVAWLAGLFLDANLDFGTDGFLMLRVLLPILAMGGCIVKGLPKNDQEKDEQGG